MRFRLRTLLILVTVVAIYFAWVAFWRQKAVFHRREAARLIAGADSAGGSMSRRELEMWTELLGSDRAHRYTDSALRELVRTSDIRNLWKRAIYHEAAANDYQRAAWQPWTLYSSNPLTGEQRPMFRFSIRDVLWLTALVAMALAWWIDRSRLIDTAAYEHTMLVKMRRLGWDVEAIMRQEGKDRRMFQKIPPP